MTLLLHLSRCLQGNTNPTISKGFFRDLRGTIVLILEYELFWPVFCSDWKWPGNGGQGYGRHAGRVRQHVYPDIRVLWGTIAPISRYIPGIRLILASLLWRLERAVEGYGEC